MPHGQGTTRQGAYAGQGKARQDSCVGQGKAPALPRQGSTMYLGRASHLGKAHGQGKKMHLGKVRLCT
jgi:hypothetical protein